MRSPPAVDLECLMQFQLPVLRIVALAPVAPRGIIDRAYTLPEHPLWSELLGSGSSHSFIICVVRRLPALPAYLQNDGVDKVPSPRLRLTSAGACEIPS